MNFKVFLLCFFAAAAPMDYRMTANIARNNTYGKYTHLRARKPSKKMLLRGNYRIIARYLLYSGTAFLLWWCFVV